MSIYYNKTEPISTNRALKAFARREQENKEQTTIVCNITGIASILLAPCLPKLHGLSYDGLHALANAETARHLASYKYSEEHHKLAPTVLAGAILSLLSSLELRSDSLSATEANIILAELPLFQLSTVLTFLGTLERRHCKRLPSISLEERYPDVLTRWHSTCLDAFATAIAERQLYEPPARTKTAMKEAPKLSAIKTQARTLFKSLKDDGFLPSRLATILAIALQKDNILTIGDELRKNLVTALDSLGHEDAIELAALIAEAPMQINRVERMKAKIIEDSMETASDSFDKKPQTIAQMLAARLAKTEGCGSQEVGEEEANEEANEEETSLIDCDGEDGAFFPLETEEASEADNSNNQHEETEETEASTYSDESVEGEEYDINY